MVKVCFRTKGLLLFATASTALCVILYQLSSTDSLTNSSDMVAASDSEKNYNRPTKSFGKVQDPSLFDGQKIVHIDLKGAPPKVSYYRKVFPLFKSLGATGVLMEYEDMFPYSNKDIRALNAYSGEDIKSILKTAAKHSLEVIPLIQTFGHLEFILKLREFEDLRETPRYPQVICPSRNGTNQLLKSMIDDVIALHPRSKYLHIGCDEVYNLGECNICRDVMLKKGWIKKQLFLNHVTTIARYIKEKYPDIVPLVWDDEFREMSVQELSDAGVSSLVEPVVWKYSFPIEEDLQEDIWDKYATVFGSLWIASAFKGATGPDKVVTDVSYHLENHRSWMNLVARYKGRISFKGIMLTGWQRYDHFAVLCELLPVALPSLAVNLAFISQGNIDLQSVPTMALQTLKCGSELLYSKMAAHCHFPGSILYEKAHTLMLLLEQITKMEETNEFKGWLTKYNIKTGFSSPVHVEGASAEVNYLNMELAYLQQDISRAMSEMYDDSTIEEWIYTFISPVKSRLQAIWDAKEELLSSRVWPRRPLKFPNKSEKEL